MKKILILCTGNSCRSQIAHGFLNHFTDNSFSIFSAGIEKHGLNKNAVKSMADIGIDISHHNSNLIDEYKDEKFDFIIKSPPASHFIKEAAKLKGGSKEPGRVIVGSITKKQAEAIAKEKMKDLNANDINEAIKIISGSARSMGIEVKD